MSGKGFADLMMDESGFQFKACLNGVSEQDFVAKPLEEMMSIREILEHHTECCIAVQKDFNGQKFKWGTFKFPEGSVEELVMLYEVERARAVALAIDNFDIKPNYAKDYIIAHEFYHVGQLAAIRIALKNGWEPYSIYRF
jgi:hypothetical protein